MSHPIIQHYVPQFLLKGFTRGKKGQLFVLDKQNDNTFCTRPHQVAAERAFYDFEVDGKKYSLESTLCELEKMASIVINKIRGTQSLENFSEEDKAIISLFIVVQHLRVFHFREVSKYLNDKVAEKIRMLGWDVNKVENFKEMSPEEIKQFTIFMIGKSSGEIASHIFHKDWVLLKTIPSQPFIISDNPVALDNKKDFGPYGNIGFAVSGIEIYLPISDTLSLYILCPSFGEEIRKGYDSIINLKKLGIPLLGDLAQSEKRVTALYNSLTTGVPLVSSSDNVIHHNYLQINWANRWVFSPVNDFSLAERMFRDDERYRKGPLPQM